MNELAEAIVHARWSLDMAEKDMPDRHCRVMLPDSQKNDAVLFHLRSAIQHLRYAVAAIEKKEVDS